MSDTKKWDHECSEENAPRFLRWIATRGGVAVWRSADFSDLSASWSTPVRDALGNANRAPHWKCGPGAEPKIHTDPNKIGVFTSAKFEVVPVKLKQEGTQLVLTTVSQRRLERALQRCKIQHGDAWYRKGGFEFPEMEVRYTTGMISLSEWSLLHPEAVPAPDDYVPNLLLLGLNY